MRKQIDGLAALVQTQLGAASESGAVGGSSMRVSAAGNMPLQGLVKPPAKPVVMILYKSTEDLFMRAILSRFLYVKKAGAWRTGVRMKTILRLCKRFFEELSSQCAPGSDIRINGGEIIA